MYNLIKAEFFKLSKMPGFKILVLSCICTGIFFSSIIIIGNAKYPGYYMLYDCIGMLLVNSAFCHIFAAIFIGNEFTDNTFGNSLLSGFTRRKLFAAKILVFFAGLFQVLIIMPLIVTVCASYLNGFGMDFSMETCKSILLLLLYSLTGYATLGSVVVFLTVLIRKKAVTVGAGLVLIYIYLFARTNFSGISFLRYTYLYQIELLAFSNIKNSGYGGDTFSGGIYLAVMALTFLAAMLFSIWIFGKRELK